jgi:hypothetical protein
MHDVRFPTVSSRSETLPSISNSETNVCPHQYSTLGKWGGVLNFVHNDPSDLRWLPGVMETTTAKHFPKFHFNFLDLLNFGSPSYFFLKRSPPIRNKCYFVRRMCILIWNIFKNPKPLKILWDNIFPSLVNQGFPCSEKNIQKWKYQQTHSSHNSCIWPMGTANAMLMTRRLVLNVTDKIYRSAWFFIKCCKSLL